MKAQRNLIVENLRDIQRNDKGSYSSFRRAIFIGLILSLLALFIIRMSEAQDPFPKPGRPNIRMDSQAMRMKPPGLGLTEEQAKILERLRCTYIAEAIPIRMELLSLRVEFKHLLSDPNVQPEILFDQQRKISALQARLEELSLSFHVKAKSVFSREQLKRLPEGWTFEMGLGHEIPVTNRSGRFKKGLQ